MVRQRIDGVEFRLREYQDFSWLHEYGTVFSVIDETGSGCINFGVKSGNEKLFFKIAGAKTIESEVSQEQSVRLLREAVAKYREIRHECLIKLVKSFPHGEFFVAVFQFAEGECLFDHWNFERYKADKNAVPPIETFKQLPLGKKLKVAEKLFSFFRAVITAGYVAVDFYDSSILYDFNSDVVTFCDIDLFRKLPTCNDLGEAYFGTKRLKAPEENCKGAVIDERTNVFTLGALIFDLFSVVVNNEERYEKGHFLPNARDSFTLSDELYQVLLKATALSPCDRYDTVSALEADWKRYVNV